MAYIFRIQHTRVFRRSGAGNHRGDGYRWRPPPVRLSEHAVLRRCAYHCLLVSEAVGVDCVCHGKAEAQSLGTYRHQCGEIIICILDAVEFVSLGESALVPVAIADATLIRPSAIFPCREYTEAVSVKGVLVVALGFPPYPGNSRLLLVCMVDESYPVGIFHNLRSRISGIQPPIEAGEIYCRIPTASCCIFLFHCGGTGENPGLCYLGWIAPKSSGAPEKRPVIFFPVLGYVPCNTE